MMRGNQDVGFQIRIYAKNFTLSEFFDIGGYKYSFAGKFNQGNY